MNIFGEKVEVLVPFQRSSTINEMCGRIQRTFGSIYKYLSIEDNYNNCVSIDRCDNYNYHKDYLCDQHFFSSDAKEWMANNTLDGQKLIIAFITNQYNIILNLNIYGEIEPEHVKLLICKTLTLIIINNIKDCQLEINLLLLPLKREYPDKFTIDNNITLGVNNANGGFTTWRGNEWGRVYVWRREELDKVLVHELIHALHLDFHNYDLDIDQFFYDNFYITKKGSFLFFEAYVELWGEFLNIIFNYSYDKCLDTSDLLSISSFYDRLCSELNFSLIQVSKIMLWFGFDTFTNCGFYCKEKCRAVDNRMKEGTSIFSYYIVRSIYFYCMSDFLTVCVNNRGNGKSAMDDGNNKRRHIQYLDIIKNNIDRYGREIDSIMKKIKNDELNISDKIKNTMRMSCDCCKFDSF